MAEEVSVSCGEIADPLLKAEKQAVIDIVLNFDALDIERLLDSRKVKVKVAIEAFADKNDARDIAYSVNAAIMKATVL